MSPHRILSAIVGVATLALATVAVGATPASASDVREWTLSGVTFSDGGTLSGTVLIDDGGYFYSVDVTATGGSSEALYGTHRYTASRDSIGYVTRSVSLYVGGTNQYLRLVIPDTTSAVQGDTVALPDGSWECFNCSPWRSVVAGSIVAGSTVDTTAPVITPTVDPSSPDGDNGWYTGNPTVSFDIEDPESEIDSTTNCETVTITYDTNGQGFVCQAASAGGTGSNMVVIQRDATPPTLTPSLDKKKVLLNGAVTAQADAADAASGVLSSDCDPASTATAGLASTTCHAQDVAGNQADKDLAYTVQYVMTPLVTGKPWRADGKVTVSAKLTDADGRPISNKQAAALGCRVKLQLSGAQGRRECLTYRPAKQEFSSTWKLNKPRGKSTVKVTVRYPGSPVTTSRSTSVTIKRG